MSVSNWMLVVGMLLTFGVAIILGFLGLAAVFLKRLFAKIEEYTNLCVKMLNMIQDVEETKKKTTKLYEEAQAEKKYEVVNNEIKLVPKLRSTEEVG